MAITDKLDPSPFGINSHVAADPMLDAIADAGVRWFRVDIDWSHIQPTENGPLLWTELDRTVEWAGRRGVSLLGSVAYTPQWAWATGENPKYQGQKPRAAGPWEAFVEATVQRYSGRVAAFSIWNEPNVARFWDGSVDEYLRLVLLPGIAAARRANPEVVIVGPDLSSSDKKGHPVDKWLVPILRSGARFDVISHHQYDGGNDLGQRVRLIERFEKARGQLGSADQPLWITEIGFRFDSEVPTLDEQAARLRATVRAMYSRPWWAKTFWYASHGDGWGVFEGENMRPTPSLGALRAATEDAAVGQAQAQRAARALLGRTGAPGPDEERQWLVNLLGEGGSIERLLETFIRSREFLDRNASPANLADALYGSILGREPDADGRSETVQSISDGRLSQRVAAMLKSDEFLQQLGQRRA